MGNRKEAEEVFLYGCDSCSTVKFSFKNNGLSWCVMCQVCKSCEFHIQLEKKNDSKTSEKQVDEH